MKGISPSEARERLGLMLAFAVFWTIVLGLWSGRGILDFLLHKHLATKIIDAAFALLGPLLIIVIWRFYFCLRELARHNDSPPRVL